MMARWDAQIKARYLDNEALPSGSTPQGPSSMRVLPNVHEDLRQNDPKASFSQPVVKKAPPTLGRPRPSGFYSGAEPPRIGVL